MWRRCAVLLLGPGTSITHAAVNTAAENNCLMLWAGEQGVRFYAQGMVGARHSRHLLRHAEVVSNPLTRLHVVVRMYCICFDEPPGPGLTLQQLRGKEGIRVREVYAKAAAEAGVEWRGRSYDRGRWEAADPVNRALSAANACLYGLAHAAVLSGGYSPALGFIHTGKQLSFVYDVADLYKVEFTVPLALRLAKDDSPGLERRVRVACRDQFREGKLTGRILPDVARVLDLSPEGPAAGGGEFAEDPALPADWWTPAGMGAETPIGQILSLKARTADGLAAAWELLDRGLGRPAVAVEVEDDSRKVRLLIDL